MHKLTLITLAALSLSACGYLDEDMALSDEEFAASLDGDVHIQHLSLGEEIIRVGGVGFGYGTYSSSHGPYGHHWGRRVQAERSPTNTTSGSRSDGFALGNYGWVVPTEEDEERRASRELGVEEAFLFNHALVEKIASGDREPLKAQGL